MARQTLTSSEGMILTNGEAYGVRVDSAEWDSAENWQEIPLSEYEARLNKETGAEI